ASCSRCATAAVFLQARLLRHPVDAAPRAQTLLFFFTAPPPTELYTLSLHDALPIYRRCRCAAPLPDLAGSARDAPHASSPSPGTDRKSTRLNSSHVSISYAVFCLKKKTKSTRPQLQLISN